MRYAALSLCFWPVAAVAATVGHVEATVVAPATMTDRGHIKGERSQPAQIVVLKNRDGSTTIRADY